MGGKRLLQAHGTQPLGGKRGQGMWTRAAELTPPEQPALSPAHQGPWLLAPVISTSTRPAPPANVASGPQRKTSSREKSHLGLDDFHRPRIPTFFYIDIILAA